MPASGAGFNDDAVGEASWAERIAFMPWLSCCILA